MDSVNSSALHVSLAHLARLDNGATTMRPLFKGTEEKAAQCECGVTCGRYLCGVGVPTSQSYLLSSSVFSAS